MRICVIGKFPPIQGGVSMRTYWTAHALAKRGHDVRVELTPRKRALRFGCICGPKIGSVARANTVPGACA